MTPDPTHPDAQQRKFLSELLRTRAAELSRLAAAELVRSAPTTPALNDRACVLASEGWAEHYHGRLLELAAAIASGRPCLFANQVAWTAVAFASRGVSVDNLRQSLRALSSVLKGEVPPEDAALVESFLNEARSQLDSNPPSPPAQLSAATLHGRLGASYLLAVLEGDRRRAASVVVDAVRQGMRVRDAYTEVLIPVQRELGRMWHANELSIAEEHFATATTQCVMAQLMSMIEPPQPTGRTVVTAAVAGNSHDLGVRVIADFFEMAGWRSVCLGADVPGEELVHACRDFRADALALSATLPVHLRQVEHAVALVRGSLDPSPKIIVGGLAFAAAAELWRDLGADGCAQTADEAVALANTLVLPIPNA